MQGHTVYSIVRDSEISDEVREQMKVLQYDSFTRSTASGEEREKHDDQYWNIPIAEYIVAMRDKRLVGVVGLALRMIQYNNGRIALGGFSGVCVVSELRQQGIAGKMVGMGMEELRKMDCDIAYLCTDVKNPSLVRLYGRVGFVLLGKPHSYIGKSGKLYVDEDGMIAPVCSQEIFDLIMEDKAVFHIGDGNW